MIDINDYITNRLDGQMKFYSSKSKHYKKCYYSFNIAILIISALSSVVSYLSLKFSSICLFPIIGIFLSSSIPVIVGIDKLMKCQELHISYRATQEKLKQEKILFINEVGEYENVLCDERNKLFITRCESIMANENNNWIQLNEKKKD